MAYKVGALIIKDNCILLQRDKNVLGIQYEFPMWDFEVGCFPIEIINDKVKTEFGINKDKKEYMGKFDINKTNVYLYLIKWGGEIKSKKYAWVHKDEVIMNKRNLPFHEEILKEIF